MGDGVEEGEPVIRDKDETRADKPELGEGDACEDDGTHALACNGLANVAVAAADGGAALEEQVEGPHGDGGDGDEAEGGEEDAAVFESLGQEHDACADKGLEKRKKGFCCAGVALFGHGLASLVPWAAHERTGLVGAFILVVVVVARAGTITTTTAFLVRHQVRVLIIRISQVLTGKGSIQVQKLDKVAGDGDAGATMEAGPATSLLLVALQHVVAAEALGLGKLGGGHVGVRAEQVRGGGAVRMGKGHGALHVGFDGDAEEVAVNIATL